MTTRSAVTRRLRGIKDAHGQVGEFARGKTIYGGGTTAAHRGGGPQYGRPVGSKDMVPRRSSVRRRIAARRRG